MKEYMEYETFEERLIHMIFGLSLSPDHYIELGEKLAKTVDEIVGELTERERVVLLNHVKNKETTKEQAERYEIGEDEIKSVLARALRKVRHPSRSRRLAAFIKQMPDGQSEKV